MIDKLFFSKRVVTVLSILAFAAVIIVILLYFLFQFYSRGEVITSKEISTPHVQGELIVLLKIGVTTDEAKKLAKKYSVNVYEYKGTTTYYGENGKVERREIELIPWDNWRQDASNRIVLQFGNIGDIKLLNIEKALEKELIVESIGANYVDTAF